MCWVIFKKFRCVCVIVFVCDVCVKDGINAQWMWIWNGYLMHDTSIGQTTATIQKQLKPTKTINFIGSCLFWSRETTVIEVVDGISDKFSIEIRFNFRLAYQWQSLLWAAFQPQSVDIFNFSNSKIALRLCLERSKFWSLVELKSIFPEFPSSPLTDSFSFQ